MKIKTFVIGLTTLAISTILYGTNALNANSENQPTLIAQSRVYGAIAYNSRGEWGKSWSHPTARSAEQAALNQCQRHGLPCKVVAFDRCGAFARARDGSTGWARHYYYNQAIDNAINACSQYNPYCQLVTAHCADGSGNVR